MQEQEVPGRDQGWLACTPMLPCWLNINKKFKTLKIIFETLRFVTKIRRLLVKGESLLNFLDFF